MSAVRNKLTQLRDKRKYGLLRQYLRDCAADMGVDLKPFYWIREWTQDGPPPRLKDDPASYTFEFFGTEEIKRIGQIKGYGFDTEKLLTLFRDGAECYGVKKDGEIAAFTWIDCARSNFKGYPVPMAAHEAYLFNLYTCKPYRGKNMAPYLRYRTYQILRERGITVYYSVTEFFNAPSWKFKQKIHSKILKFGCSLELFRRYFKSWILREYPG
ncbi:MAG: hypothetical protein GF333_06890 [Candidatus Omnitrophica bacterium]|nr:hypothetical protein [Candidatus Omnitrophota bacterium]